MTRIDQARSAYIASGNLTRTDRNIEYNAFARITSALKRAASAGADTFPDLVKAVHDNRQLWSILASDVASRENALPEDLRARIFYLAEFTQHHSRQVLKGEADPAALIEINTAIMRGLNTKPEAA